MIGSAVNAQDRDGTLTGKLCSGLLDALQLIRSTRAVVTVFLFYPFAGDGQRAFAAGQKFRQRISGFRLKKSAITLEGE